MKLTNSQISLFSYFSYYEHLPFFSGKAFLTYYLADNNVGISQLNNDFNTLIEVGLIGKKNGDLYLTDYAKNIAYSTVFLPFDEYKTNIFLVLNDFSCDKEKDFSNQFEISEKEFSLLKKAGIKRKQEIENSNKTNSANTFTFFGTLFFVLSMFLVGIFISKIRQQSIQDGFFVAFFVISLSISIIFYAISFYVIKNDYFSPKLLTSPILLSVLGVLNCVSAGYQLYLIVKFSTIYLVSFFIIVLFCLIFILFSIYFGQNKLIFEKYSTYKLIEKLYSNSYFIDGIDVLDPKNHEIINGVKVELFSPTDNTNLGFADKVIKINRNKNSAYLAVKKIQDITYLFLIRNRDLKTIVKGTFNNVINDEYLTFLAEKENLLNKVNLLEKDLDYEYSSDNLLRFAMLSYDDEYFVVIEIACFVDDARFSDGSEVPSFDFNEEGARYTHLLRQTFLSKTSATEYLELVKNSANYDNVIKTFVNNV